MSSPSTQETRITGWETDLKPHVRQWELGPGWAPQGGLLGGSGRVRRDGPSHLVMLTGVRPRV